MASLGETILTILAHKNSGLGEPSSLNIDQTVDDYKKSLVAKGAGGSGLDKLVNAFRQNLVLGPAGAPTTGAADPTVPAPVAPPVAGAVPPATPTPADPPPPSPTTATLPVAEAYKSPPDLVEMYSKLMDKERRQEGMNRGMTLVAAGLAQDQNKQSLIQLAGQANGSGGTPSMTDLINLQKLRTEEEDKSRQRSMLPELMTKYGLDQATITYLDATGQLDDTIQQLVQPDTEVVQSADGSKKLINKTTGETIKELSAKTPRATEFVEMGDKTKVLVYSDDKTRVDDGKALTNIAAPANNDIITAADGSTVLVNKDTGENLGTVTPAKEDGTRELTRADGSKAVYNEKTGEIVKELSPPTVLNADDKDKLAQINTERAAAGKPPMTMEEYNKQSRGGINVNVGPQGETFRAPPESYEYIRNADGTVKVFDDGKPHMVVTPGSPGEADATQKALEANKTALANKAAETAAATTTETALDADTAKAVKHAIDDQDITDAIAFVDKGGNAGWGALMNWWPASEQMALRDNLNSIRTSIGIQALTAMRLASPTGAALGNVTETENAMLQKDMGALNQMGKPEILRFHLRRIQVARNLILNGVLDSTYTNPATKDPALIHYRKPTVGEISDAMNAVKEESAATERDGYKVQRLDVPTSGKPNYPVPTGN